MAEGPLNTLAVMLEDGMVTLCWPAERHNNLTVNG